MDPYLEAPALWSDFHEQLAVTLSEMLSRSLSEHYRLRRHARRYELEVVLFTSVNREPRTEPFLEIRQRGETKALTVIDIVSPTNKTTTLGRTNILTTRRETLRQNADYVEIDLVLDGQSVLNLDPAGLPVCDYTVIITRSMHPDRHHVYTSTLSKTLPRVRIPLGGEHRDIDLQAAFTRTFEQGQFAARIDYSQDPPVPLNDEQRSWLRDLLKRHKLRD
jgi:hypothetical protein